MLLIIFLMSVIYINIDSKISKGNIVSLKYLIVDLEKYIEVNGKEVVIKDIEKNINSYDIDNLNVPSSIKEGFFDEQNSVLYYDRQLTAVAKKLINFNQTREKYL